MCVSFIFEVGEPCMWCMVLNFMTETCFNFNLKFDNGTTAPKQVRSTRLLWIKVEKVF